MISILTPVHRKSAPYLPEAHRSLQKQTYQDFEWVLVPNGGATIPPEISADPWVRIFPLPDEEEHNRIGRLKRYAATQAKGTILVELDADDLLTPDALGKIAGAFLDTGAAMVYSNCAEFENDTWQGRTYDPVYGWHSRPFEYMGHSLLETISPPVRADTMRSVLYAPNHVRAWATADYWSVGGHNEELRTGDDHELMCRLYAAFGERRFCHINECLYLYRLHGQNSSQTHNGEVHAQVERNYVRYARDMINRWATDNNLPRVDLGGRLDCPQGYISVDLFNADIQADLNDRWPFEDASIGVLRASHLIEHLRDPIHTMNEAHRVLVPGGWFLIDVPSTDGRGAFQDPTHVSFWNENSFWYYTDRNYANYIPAYRGRFQAARVVTYYPDQWWQQRQIPVVSAHLIALKEGYEPMGEVKI